VFCRKEKKAEDLKISPVVTAGPILQSRAKVFAIDTACTVPRFFFHGLIFSFILVV
jgi:hypothetical protein